MLSRMRAPILWLPRTTRGHASATSAAPRRSCAAPPATAQQQQPCQSPLRCRGFRCAVTATAPSPASSSSSSSLALSSLRTSSSSHFAAKGSVPPSAAGAAATCVASRRFNTQPPSMSAFGSMVPFQGYISPDLVSAPIAGGGQHKRGVITTADLPYDREVIRVPAYLLHVAEGKPRHMVVPLVRTCLKRFVDDKRHASYISKRLLSLMVGGNPIFRSEDDVRDLILDVEGANLLFSKGLLTTLDIHRLGCAIWFNRVDVEYKGMQGLALFPEVSYFNHSCEPNVALAFSWDVETGDYVCTARTLKPVHAGDQLLIHYFPEAVDEPLSRLQRRFHTRWAFTCLCPQCRTRTVLATLCAAFILMITCFVPLALYSVYQRKEKLVNAGIA